MANSLPVMILALVTGLSSPAADSGSSCLPAKEARQIEKAHSSSHRVWRYAKIAHEQAKRAFKSSYPGVVWADGEHTGAPYGSAPSVRHILEAHDCAMSELSKELDTWKPQTTKELRRLRESANLLGKANESLIEARQRAGNRPDLQRRIEASLMLLEDVRYKLDSVLDGPVPGS